MCSFIKLMIIMELNCGILLFRPGFYSNRIREKALKLICEQIRRAQTLYLMRSLEKFPPLEKTIVMREILYVT